MWTGDTYLEDLYKQAEAKRNFTARSESPEAKQARLKASLRRAAGEFELNKQDQPVRLESVQCQGYTRERIELSALPGLSFGAYVLIPDAATANTPGVIAVHGHGYGSRQISGLLEDGSADTGEADGYHHFAVQLVQKGLVVIAPDVSGFGERRLEADLAENPDAPNSCHRMSTQLLMLGKTLTGLRVTELLHTLDYFSGRQEVDPSRIGIVGFSGGSLLAFIVAAVDERILASVLIGFPNTFKDSIMSVRHCICNYVPDILKLGELPELIGLIAPRPLFLESGSNDPIFPVEGFKQAVKELKQLYAQAGVSENLQYDLFPGAHEVSGRNSFDWLHATLAKR
ncbi:MAG: alpha/beta hydrolase family protein [Gorillibacterium sp.]|nr:alpha/beta hydrolase family protein [Gorillibacterium sp.]